MTRAKVNFKGMGLSKSDLSHGKIDEYDTIHMHCALRLVEVQFTI